MPGGEAESKEACSAECSGEFWSGEQDPQELAQGGDSLQSARHDKTPLAPETVLLGWPPPAHHSDRTFPFTRIDWMGPL